MPLDHSSLPIDPASTAALADGGLRMRLVDPGDRDAYETWLQSANRGFHGGILDEEHLRGFASVMADRRNTGVYDGDEPVATINAFHSPVTVPGRRDLPAWAISMVTVAPTHRRRGIARELLQSELRTAVGLGIPMAMLTVSESTIYSRFGFAPATMASSLTINTGRAHWAGSTPGGRVRFVALEELRPQVDELYATARLASPGEMSPWPRRWDQIVGMPSDEKDLSKRPRAVRYFDESGAVQGFAIYKVTENEQDSAASTADLKYLMANTTDAYAALWRFVLELDLVATVTSHLRPVDEPMRWQVSDFRSVKVETYEHLWLRILDVPTCLEAREYFAPIDLVLEVTDVLGHASGRYRVTNQATTPVDTSPSLTLSINELSALYLGGVSATTLLHAGRITENAPNAAAQLDAAFRSPVTPWLSTWF